VGVHLSPPPQGKRGQFVVTTRSTYFFHNPLYNPQIPVLLIYFLSYFGEADFQVFVFSIVFFPTSFCLRLWIEPSPFFCFSLSSVLMDWQFPFSPHLGFSFLPSQGVRNGKSFFLEVILPVRCNAHCFFSPSVFPLLGPPFIVPFFSPCVLRSFSPRSHFFMTGCEVFMFTDDEP